METFILWAGFAGAWLLFAGPIYQAALELKEEDIEIDRIKAAGASIPKPKTVSVWWWLLPPMKMLLEQRRSRKYRRVYIESLLPEDIESLISFMNKATAWLLVATGGLCIALKETYELSEHAHWNDYIFWPLVIILVLLSVLHVIARLSRSKNIIKKISAS